MRIIPTRLHGLLDYVVGALLIASPWLFDFADGSAAQWVPVIIGVMVLLQTILTDFELGIIHKIAMVNHLRMDLLVGVFLAVAPWIFDFNDRVWEPHVAFGVFSILASIMTKTVPSYRTNQQGNQSHR